VRPTYTLGYLSQPKLSPSGVWYVAWALGCEHSGKSGQSNTEVVIRGPSRAAVRAARTRVELCLDSALSTSGWQSLPYTHFVSIPLASDRAEAVLTRLKASCLAADGGSAAEKMGLEEAMFWEPKQLHLTLGMLKLYSAQVIACPSCAVSSSARALPLPWRFCCDSPCDTHSEACAPPLESVMLPHLSCCPPHRSTSARLAFRGITVLVKHGTSAREKGRARSTKKAVGSSRNRSKANFSSAITCSQARHVIRVSV